MRKLTLVVLVIGFLSLPLMAQGVPKVEVFGGYQYLNIGGGNTNGPTSSEGFSGWDAAVTGKFSKHLGVEGDFGGAYATISGVSFKVYTYTGGPVVFADAGRIKPFVHALFGGIHLSGSESGASISWNGYTAMAGGGVDVKVNPVIGVRLIQADWLYYNFSSTSVSGVSVPGFNGSNNVRVATGIVLRF